MTGKGQKLQQGIKRLWETEAKDWTELENVIKFLRLHDIVSEELWDKIESIKSYVADNYESLDVPRVRAATTVMSIFLDDMTMINFLGREPHNFDELIGILDGMDLIEE